MARKRNSLYITVWPVNGAPIPEDLAQKVEAAVQEVVNGTKDKSVRLLMQVGKE